MIEFFKYVERAIEITEENDPDVATNYKVPREIQRSLNCYKEL